MDGRALMDYASATPGDAPNSWDQYWYGDIWNVPVNATYNGLIIRKGSSGGMQTGIPLTAASDGLSNTLIVSEKRLDSGRYTSGDWHDDQGWIDGWDPDVVRYTAYRPERDAPGLNGYEFGSNHSNGMNGLFGDGSVRFIRFTVDPTVFNNLGHRSDGVAVNLSSL